ncbi:MAG: carbohydrate ABC transporter permease, partial [Clostridiaceae bacterium]|nr:carbohydrate ABC transporter permease [Clostridiaceae bacterium]
MHRKITIGFVLSKLLLAFLLIMTFLPILTMFNMSLKSTVLIRTNFWSLPTSIYWTNYEKAFKFVFRPVLNSLLICMISLVGIIILVALAGYAFGKMQFKGKKIIYSMVICVMMIPYTLLIIPNYEIVETMKLLNTYWALILPYVFGQQVFGIVLAETFYSSLPNELFEAAKIDGASEFQKFSLIALPLSKPILITVGITAFNSMYNDYIWPTIVLSSGDEFKTFCQVVFNNAAGKGTNDLGL